MRKLCLIIFFLCFNALCTDTNIVTIPTALEEIQPEIIDFKISPRDEKLAVLLNDNTLRIYSMQDNAEIHRFSVRQRPIKFARIPFSFSPDGEKIAVGSSENLFIFNFSTNKKELLSDEMNYYTTWRDYITLDFSADGSKLAISSLVFDNRNELHICDLDPGKIRWSQQLHTPISTLSFWSDKALITAGPSDNPTIWHFDADNFSNYTGNVIIGRNRIATEKVIARPKQNLIYIEPEGGSFISFDSLGQPIGRGVPMEVQDSGMTVSCDGTLVALSCLSDLTIYEGSKKECLYKEIKVNTRGIKEFSRVSNNIIFIANRTSIKRIDINEGR